MSRRGRWIKLIAAPPAFYLSCSSATRELRNLDDVGAPKSGLGRSGASQHALIQLESVIGSHPPQAYPRSQRWISTDTIRWADCLWHFRYLLQKHIIEYNTNICEWNVWLMNRKFYIAIQGEVVSMARRPNLPNGSFSIIQKNPTPPVSSNPHSSRRSPELCYNL